MNKTYSEFNALVKSLLDPKFTSDYESIDTWTSMQSLIVVSAIDEHYNVLISYEDLKEVKSLEDLYVIVMHKIS